MEIQINLESILLPLTAVLGLSLTVERVLEILTNFCDRFIVNTKKIVVKKVDDTDDLVNLEKQFKEISEIRKTEIGSKDIRKKMLKENRAKRKKSLNLKISDLDNSESQDRTEQKKQFSPLTILCKQATDPDDGITLKKFVLQGLGFVFGVILVRLSGLQLVNSFLAGMNVALISPPLDYILTGLLIGGGSAPIHALIGFVKSHKITLPNESTLEEDVKEEPSSTTSSVVTPTNTPVVTAAYEPWEDIPYNGGFECDLLKERVRSKDPNMIIFHHTAMHNNTTFEDVIKVIKDRDFQTGYNCVIHYSGSIHPFCRWDAYGTHAKGFNMKSLGLAFNGNFETGAADQWSNINGRYGAQRPSDVQLKAGARVVALWTFLYDIKLDFKKSIIPHLYVAEKACPGSNFPYDEFIRLVKYYCNKWHTSSYITAKLEEYQLRPYLYVNGKKKSKIKTEQIVVGG